MIRRYLLFVGIFSGLLLGTITVQAQDYEKMRKELQNKQQNTRQEIQSLQEQITNYQERLSETAQKYERVYKQYEDLKKVIALQDAKIKKLEEEQRHIQDEIEVTEEAYNEYQQQYNRLIENYKKTLSYLYKHGRTSELALLLTARSFNQMMVRSYYLEQFEEHRQKQVRQIREAQAKLQKKKKQLQEAKAKKEAIAKEHKQEKELLADKRRQQEKNIAILRRDRKKIQQQLSQVRQHVKDLNSTLSELIVEEEKVRKAQQDRLRRLEEERKKRLAAAKKIENARERAIEVAKYSDPVTSSEFVGSEELGEIEQSFANQKGDLPWPVENGAISGKFGTRVHPVYGTKVQNLGVEIATEARSVVRVIHDGYVFAVRPLPGFGDLVFVNHGKYKTVYGNLSQVMVRKNSYLKAGDIVGLSGDENSPKGAAVFFMIRENDHNLNPERWIVNK